VVSCRLSYAVLPSSGRTSRCGLVSSLIVTINTPIRAHPETLIRNVAHGIASAGCGSATLMPWRASLPSTPPIAIATSTSHRRARVSMRSERM
jgi:hypothetical protein